MWIILRTDARKEHYVARQVAALGFDAWVPSQIIVARHPAARRVMSKAHLQAIKELPILPRRVFAAVPVALQADLEGIRHLVAVERDAASVPLQIPGMQIAKFQAMVREANDKTLNDLARVQLAGKKQKAKWLSLHEWGLEIIKKAKQTMERAA